MPRSVAVRWSAPDETGWSVDAVLHWLWAFAIPDTTVYAIRPGRSFDDAASILGADYAGVLDRDGWAPYRRFTAALHQSCLAHWKRRTHTLRADHPLSPWAARVQAVFTDALAIRDRRDAQAISEHGLAVDSGRLLARLGRLIESTPALPASPTIQHPSRHARCCQPLLASSGCGRRRRDQTASGRARHPLLQVG